MTQRPDTLISIDPDVEKSGVAVLDTRSRRIELHTFPFPVLMDYLRDWKEAQDITHEPVRVVVEAGWLNKWRGQDGKITHAELAQFIPGLPARSNQEERDAALLAWTYAGFPVKMNVRQ